MSPALFIGIRLMLYGEKRKLILPALANLRGLARVVPAQFTAHLHRREGSLHCDWLMLLDSGPVRFVAQLCPSSAMVGHRPPSAKDGQSWNENITSINGSN